jgi:hypothetical protein
MDTGSRFGKLIVRSFSRTDRNRKSMWNCMCDCGSQTIVSGLHLKSGRVKSCGCLRGTPKSVRNEGKKVCCRCLLPMDLSNFYAKKSKNGSLTTRSTCKKCYNLVMALKKYNITIDEYEEIQRDDCYICNSTKNLRIDHNHCTGKVRKMICNRCNVAIGLLGESQELITKISNYIEEHL